MMKQKEAVVRFWTQGTQQGLQGKDLFDFIANEVFHGLVAGDIDHKSPTIRTDEKAAKRYATSLTSNHLKRAKEINPLGYTPAFKRGPIVKDQRLKDLVEAVKSLKANSADPQLIANVEAAAAARREELSLMKAASKVPSIDETMAKLAELGVIA